MMGAVGSVLSKSFQKETCCVYIGAGVFVQAVIG